MLCNILSNISFSSAQYDALTRVGEAFRTKLNSRGDNFIGAMMESISKRTEPMGFWRVHPDWPKRMSATTSKNCTIHCFSCRTLTT